MTTPETQETLTGFNWLNLLGLTVGEEVVIFPLGIAGGQALQGELIDIAFGPSGPLLVVIRNAEGRPNVSVPWSSIMMITKAEGPAVSVAQPEISVADLVEFAEKQGIEIPDDVRNATAL